MKWDAFWLPKSVFEDKITHQMPILQFRVWATHAGVVVSQWAADTIGISQDIGSLAIQWIDTKVRERIREITQSMNMINTHGAGHKECDLLTDRCITQTSDQESKWLLWKWEMPVSTNLNCQ
jgi:hypothetical protein